MKIACLSFTHKGKELGDKLKTLSEKGKYLFHHYSNDEIEGGIKSRLDYIWKEYNGLVFISSTGIAIRMINSYIKNKTMDPAIVVIDDCGRFSISLLSGHLGGANELSNWIAKAIDAMPVITTASDNRGIEAIDIFAKKNNYYMDNMKLVTKITGIMVNGKTLGFYSEDNKTINYPNIVTVKDLNNIPSEIEGLVIVSSENQQIENINIPYIYLRPRNINIGIGCRKGVDGKRIIESVKSAMKELNLSENSIQAIGTVEVKKDEEGIIEAAKYFNCPIKIFAIEEIKEVEDKFEKSQFVKDTIGVYSVSEPSAYLLGGKLIKEKSKYNGITISISKEIRNG